MAAAAKPTPSFWRGKRVLLTGHTGFKGSWLALWLARMGAEVTGLALAPATEPNLFTLAALFGGFYSVVMAMNGRFDMAAVGVFCAMVLDSLDGRVARMTNTQSEFGAQLDSLADMVAFGAAHHPLARYHRYCCCAGRHDELRYRMPHEELLKKYRSCLNAAPRLPEVLAREMGDQLYIASFEDEAAMQAFRRDALARPRE